MLQTCKQGVGGVKSPLLAAQQNVKALNYVLCLKNLFYFYYSGHPIFYICFRYTVYNLQSDLPIILALPGTIRSSYNIIDCVPYAECYISMTVLKILKAKHLTFLFLSLPLPLKQFSSLSDSPVLLFESTLLFK